MVRIDKLPFYAGEDIKEEDLNEYFCDRENEIKEIVRSLSSKQKQHFALIGKRRIGKSSFMVKCKTELKKMNISSIYIKLEKVYPFNINNFFTFFLEEIKEVYSKDLKYQLKKTGKEFLKSVKPKKIGVDIANIISIWSEFKETDNKKSLQKLIKETFAVLDQVGQQNKKFVIMLDEFQRLFELKSDFLWSLRGYISDLKYASFIVSSSLTAFKDEITKNKKQPFFKFFFIKEIKEIPKLKVRPFIKKRFKEYQINITKDALNLFLELSNGHPYYVQVLGLKCYDVVKANDLNFIDREIVLKAYGYLFDMIPHNLISEFGRLTGKMKEIIILMAKKELERPRDIARELGINVGSIGGFLKKIEDRHGIIESIERGKYKFNDIFLKEWIKRTHISEKERNEEDLPGFESKENKVFNSELVNNYSEILKTTELSLDNKSRLLQSIRSETHKIFSQRKVEKKDVPIIENFVDFGNELLKENNDEINLKIFDIFGLLTRTEETLTILKSKSYDQLKSFYENGNQNKDLIKLLHDLGYFVDIITDIMNALDENDQNLFEILISRFDYLKYKKQKFTIIKKLLLRLDKLDSEKDKNLILKIENFINQLEIS